MEPEHLRFGGGATETVLHPLVAVWLILAILLILTLRRDKAIIPFLLAFFTIPVGQVVLAGGLHLTALRILILAGLARRIASSGQSSEGRFPGKYNPIDQAVVLWTISTLVVISLQWMNSQALVKNLGDFLDALGGFLVVRFLITDGNAVRRAIKVLAAICVIQGASMLVERITLFNVFALVGGGFTVLRDGVPRSQGVLGCIAAGAFAGILAPLFMYLWAEGKSKSRVAAGAGIVGAAAMAVTSNSSTAWMAIMGSLVGLAFWRFRTRMRNIRWGLVIVLIGLHLVMKAPVWALIARIDLTGSSSSWQRYALVDMTIRHFSDWWLLGYRYYNNWGWGAWDTVNEFVDVALKGGLLTLSLYILILKRSFGAIGNARKQVNGDREQEWFLWCLGSALFASIVASFGINFMAQLIVLLFTLLACISVATSEVRPLVQTAEVPAQVPFAFSPRNVGTPLLPHEEGEKARHNFPTPALPKDLSLRGRERITSLRRF